MKNYKHIFFDLDETLWDFRYNSRETLKDIYRLYQLEEKGMKEEEFCTRYMHHNNFYWDLFRKGQIGRQELRLIRFSTTLREFKIGDELLAQDISESYLKILPTKSKLYDDTIEVLTYLKDKYSLHIITNGFEEVQYRKLHHSGITSYFKYVITSEMAGCQKPDRQIFKYAFDKANASVLDSIFVGDSIEADITGAKSIGMDHVFFNPEHLYHNESVTFEISSLKELMGFL